MTRQGQVEKKILVPNTAVGIIIGKAGQTIQMLQQQVRPCLPCRTIVIVE